jgi:colanic acid/amylovoran biosynthesis glycosyltransferase
MRVLFFNSHFPQPSQTFVVDQIRHAERLGLDVTVYAKRYSAKLAAEHAPDLARLVRHDRPRDAATLGRLGAGLARAPGRLGQYLGARRRLALHASDLACALQLDAPPDVIVANFGQNGVVAARIKEAFFPSARLAVIFHGWDVSAYVAAHGWDAYRRAAMAIDIAIAVNRPWAERLRANTPIRDVVVHHLGVDLAKVRPPPPRAEARQGFGIVFVGRMVEKKGLAYLIAAMALLRDRGHAVTVAVVGDGPEEAALKQAAVAAGVGDAIVFHGRQPNEAVLGLMAEADCLVLPSVTAADGDQEGIPVTLMEAMATGLPVVSTWHSGIPELVSDGETGLLVPERDAVALAGAIERLIAEPGLGPRLAAQARDFVAAEFNAEIQNQRLFELILGR